jgi:tape measure domain-containing protein
VPTEVLHIVVDDQGGARVVTRNLENLGRAGDRAEKAAQFLKRALIGIGAAATLRQLVQLSDQVTRMGNTLRTNFGPGGVGGKANAALAELSEIAARSRGSLAATVETYDTLVDATERLGVSTDRLLPITETALKLFRIGGQDADQAAGSVRALGAAIASNDFSRAITTLLRQNLDFANAIAKGYGTNAEELRKFAKDGRLTAESFLAALERVKAETDETFGLTQSTIGEATGQVRDSLTLLVGKFFETTGSGRELVDALAGIAKHLRELANDTARMDAIAKPFVATLRALGEAAQRTSFTFGGNPDLFGLGGVSNAGIQERLSQLREMQRILQTPADQLGFFDRARKALIPDDDAFSPGRIQADIARLEAEQRRRFLANAKPPPGFVPKPEPTTTTTGGGGTPDPRALLAAGNAAAAELEKQAKAAQDAVEAFNRLRAAQDPLVAAGQEYAESIQTINAAAATGRIGQEALSAAYKGATDELMRAREEAELAATEDFRQLQERLDPLTALTNRYNESLTVLAAAAAPGKIPLEELAAAKAKLDEEFAKGKEDLAEGPSLFDGIVVSADRALDSLVTFASTGKGSIRDFVSSALADLQKLILKLLIVQALKAAANSTSGGIGSFLTGLAEGIGGARATGGPVSPGKAFLVGERGPELFVPPSTGNIVPNDRLGAGAQNVTIVNVMDQSEVARMIGSAEGEKAILNVVSRNRGRVRQSISG